MSTYSATTSNARTAVYSGIDPLIQLRNLVNLLMILSMILSLISPIFNQPLALLPDFVDWSTAPPPRTAPAPTTDSVGLALPAAPAPGVPDRSPVATDYHEMAGVSAASLGESLAPNWLGATPRHATAPKFETSELAVELGEALAPTWMATDTGERTGAQDVQTAVAERDLLSVAEVNGAELSPPGLPGMATAQGEELLGTSLISAWYTGADGAENALGGSGESSVSAAGSVGSGLESVLFDTVEPNQCSGAARVEFNLAVPPYPVSRGNVDGDVYTVTVKNNDTLTTTNVALEIDPNAGFYYLGDSATVVSSISGTLTYSDTGTDAPDASARITVTGDITSTTLDVGETMTFTFRLATNADAISAQQLQVKLFSGELECGIARVANVKTVRGNLVVQKSPNIRSAWLADRLGWSITLRNTGLGTVYGAEVTDTFGAGYIDTVLTDLPTVPITLPAGASATYYVTGTVNACNQLTNTVDAWWSIGNQDNTATSVNPATSQVDVRFNLVNPNVTLQAAPSSVTIPFCTSLTQPVVVTATASATAKNFKISANLGSFTPSNLSSGWSYAEGVFTFNGGSPAGYIYAGEPVTLTFDLNGPTACTSASTHLSFQPTYSNACDISFTGAAVQQPTISQAPNRPTLNVTLSGPYSVRARQTFNYEIDLSAANIQNITDTIHITDVIPSSLIISGTAATTGSVSLNGQEINWTIDTPGSGNLNATLVITVTVRDDVACSAYSVMHNSVIATAPTCPSCSGLTDSDSRNTYMEDVDGPLAGVKTVSGDTEVCGVTGFLFENLYYVDLPINPAAMIFTETLGMSPVSGLSSPLLYQTDTLSVTLNGVDASTRLTTTATSPQLVVDMTRLRELLADVAIDKQSVPEAVNAGDTLTYTLVVSNSGPADADGVTVSDTLPAGLTLSSMTSNQGECGAFPCTLGNLAANTSAVITVVATVDSDRAADIVNAAYVTFDGIDNRMTNNQAVARTQVTATVLPSATDLTIARSGEPVTVTAGNQVTYTMTVTNNGGVQADNVTVVDALPFSFTLVNVTSSQGACNAFAHPLTCNLGNLAVAATATITVVAVADATVSADVVNTAQAIADNPDRNLLDNQASAQTHVIKRIPLYVSYRVIAPENALGGAVAQTWHDWSLFYVDGLNSACRANDTLYMGTSTTIRRGDLGIGINAATPNSCEPERVTLNVTGGSSAQLTDKLAVTLTLGANDVYTVAGYGGFFAANPPSSVISSSNRITWTWATDLPITASGTIDVDVLRPCAATGDLVGNVSFLDRCDAPFTKNAVHSFTATAPNLYLFLTPDKYEIVDKTAVWTAYLINTGNGDAVNALITNTLGSGLAFSYSVVSGATGVITKTGVGDGNDVQWLIPRLAVGAQLRIDVVADVIACSGLNMQAFAAASCLSGTCSRVGPEEVTLVRAPAALLSSNRQVAELPLCETGPVELIVQNASAGATEYNFVVTDTLQYVSIVTDSIQMTVTNRTGAIITTTNAFTPIITTDGYTQTLVWDSSDLPPGDPLRTILDERAAGDVIRIGFLVQTKCWSADQSEVWSDVTAVDACQGPLTSNESAVTLETTEPDLEVTKLMRNATSGAGFVANGFAGAGDTIVYQVVVNNLGQQRVTNLFVEDQLPSTFELVALDPVTSSQSGTPPLLKWHEEGGKTLNVNDTMVYHITGTVTADACTNPDTVNQAVASYGCSTSDTCAAATSSVTTTFSTQPSFTLATPSATVDQCSGGPIVVNFPNAGARAENVVITYTLPSGLAYAGLTAGYFPEPTISPTVGASGTITWLYDVINQEITTNTLRFNVTNAAGICVVTGSQTGTAALGYEDSCGNGHGDVTPSDTSITVHASDIVVNQSPLTRTIVVDQVYTWTVTITNAGNSATNNLLVTQTVGNGWQVVNASTGSPGGAAPVTSTDTVTWIVGALAGNNATWTATFSARAVNAEADYRTILTATTACDDGGCLQAASHTAYASPINLFTKSAAISEATIGDLITFTVKTDLYGNVPYTDTFLTDTLPTGLGYVSATLLLIEDLDGSPSSQQLVPSSAPAANASGEVVWSLGDLTGQVAVTAVITAVVQNLITTTYESAALTNTARLTYVDDGQPYAFGNTAQFVVTEPILHIGKTYATAAACSAALFEDNFNDGNAAGWTTSGGSWSVDNHTYRAPTGANTVAINGNTSWTDYSYSAMLRSTDATGGDIGLVFRAQSTSRYYRFRWNRNAAGTAGSHVIERVNGGTITIGSSAGSFYDLNRWYHVEVRVSGSRFQVFIDGMLALDVTDPSPAWSTGAIGFYANSHANAFFDDALVTRLDDSGCTVGAADLITYTLTISNQGQAMAHELVISDVIPLGTSLYTYTFASSDGDAQVTVEPTSIPGATGALTWVVNQLAPIDPFVTNNHSSITLTAVLSVSPTIPTGSRLTNQAALTYDSQAGDGPAGVEREYSGGSHSATVQTVDPPGLTKTVAPFTATIGQIVVYTITVPNTPITAALTNITVTDDVKVNLRVTDTRIVENPDVVNGSVVAVGQQVTATFDRVEANGQAQIVITGVVANAAINQDGVIVTNTARLEYTDGIGTLGASHFLTSNQVSTELIEPVLQIQKAATPSTGLRAGDLVTYALTIRHAPTTRSTAYDVVVTDVVPAVLEYLPDTLQVTTPSGTVVSTTIGNSLTITVSEYPTPAAPIYITYTAQVIQGAEPSSTYSNTAFVRYVSLPDTPDARTGSGVAPNDYYTSTQATIQTAPLTISKALNNDIYYTIGDLITYTVLIELPVGTTRDLIVTDTVPAGLLYVAPTSTVEVTATPDITLTYAITPSAGDGATASTAVLRMLQPVNNTTGASAILTWTMQLVVVDDADRTVNFNSAVKTNQVALTYVNAQNQTLSASDSAESTTIYEPLLHLSKSYVTDAACTATLLQDNFNAGLSGWSWSSGSWSALAGWVIAPASGASLLTRNGATFSDLSYSALVSATSTSGSIGLVFRVQDTANYYRFVWTGASRLIERVDGGSPTPVASQTAGAFIANRWYHLEVRAVGDRLTVYLDGQSILNGTDATFASGSVGFYVANNDAAFDDVLVTRMGDDGCTVDVHDLITYTLSISNQNRLTGYDLVITDVLPAHIAYVASEMASNDPSAALISSPSGGDTGSLVWRMNHLTPTTPFDPLAHSWAVITMTARVLDDVSAGVRLSNQALLTYDDMAGVGPLGIERTYSGGSHSSAVRTSDATLIKSTYPTTVTIGETFQYTLTFPGSGAGIAANLYTVTLTDTLPEGFRLIGDPAVIVDPDGTIDSADISTTRSTTKTLLVDFTTVPSITQVTVVITAVVENLAINQDGVRYTNTATLGWFDLVGDPVAPVTSNPVTTDLVEPLLIIEKTAYPSNVTPGDTVFYTLRIYHAPTSNVPAYNVQISDTLSSWLSYISGSWEANNDPHYVASTGTYTVELPNLQAYFPVLDTSLTAANPLILRYQAVVKVDVAPSTIITNVAESKWTSLPTDPYGDVRDGRGGVNDYRVTDEAQVSLDQFTITKSGPLTATAGSPITYVINFGNGSPITGTNARVVDTISFRVGQVTGTFSTATSAGVCDQPTTVAQGSQIICALGDMLPNSSGVVTITGLIDPATPDGALVDDYASFYVTDSNGVEQERDDEAETQVETLTDLSIGKTGPEAAKAGEIVTYTLVVTNVGPSNAYGVDAKDILPAGLTFVDGTTTQGACTSSICQIGEMDPGQVVTMVITASVGSNVTGVINNTGQVFSATDDHDQSNNRATAATTVSAETAIHVAKVDLTDPVYAGNTYLYQVTVTNTGPAQANNVVITDTLPPHVTFEGASPGCSYDTGMVTCAAGDMAPGTWFGFLINVRVPNTITDGTRVTNTVSMTTSTDVLTASSTLSATAQTTFSQTFGSPTDLAITKAVNPEQVTAGLSGGDVLTYTIRVTNTGPAPASAVQVTDLYPRQFTLVSATTSKPITQANCSDGGVCDLGEMAIEASALITLVFQAPSNVVSGTYTNTAYVGSASPDSDLTNNSDSISMQVIHDVTLQADKVAVPNPATPGNELSYTIFVTNTGPSHATNVSISDTLPVSFTPDVMISSQGGCTNFPCDVGTIAPNGHAWVTINGRVSAVVTAATQISNTARITSIQTPVAITAGVTPSLAFGADVGVAKQGAASAYPGDTVVYTLTVRNLGPSIANSTRVTDSLPAGLTLTGVSGCTNTGSGNEVVCLLGNLGAGAVQTIFVTSIVDNDVYPGTSLENVAEITTTSSDPNLFNNSATADTSILGKASFDIHKAQVAPVNPVTAGNLVTYTIVITNTGPGMARSVDVKDQLPAGLSLSSVTADSGVCGGTVCQFGTLAVTATRTITVVARVNSATAADTVTNTAAVFSADVNSTATATATTTIATSAVLSITKVALNEPGYAGGVVLYQLVVRNEGPSDAQDVVITDTLPVSTTYAGGDGACSAVGRTVTCEIGTLAAGDTRTLLLQANVAGEVLDRTTITNSVVVSSPTATSMSSDEVTGTVRQPSGGLADLEITKDAAGTVIAGEEITYTIVVTNRGPATAEDVQVVDGLPGDVSYVRASSSQGLCESGVSCQLGSLALNGSATITVVGLVASSVVSGTELVNMVRVDASNPDPASGNNDATVSTDVSAEALVRLVKDVMPTAATPGETVTYRIVVSNDGPSTASNVVVADTLPDEIENGFVSSSQGGCSSFPCGLGDIGPGGSGTIVVVGRIAASASGLFTNTASVTTDTALAAASETSDDAGVDVTAQADLVFALSSTPTTIAGETAVVTATVTNSGPSDAVGTVVTLTLPTGTSYNGESLPVGWYVASSADGTVVLTTTGSLAANSMVNLPITVNVDSGVQPGTSLQFNGEVTADTNDPNPTNNSGNADTSVIGEADLVISKSGPATGIAGAEITYTILITNQGETAAVVRDVKDTLPAGVALVSAVLKKADGSVTACSGAICQSGGVLARDETMTMTVVGQLSSGLSAGTLLTNTASAFTDGITPDPDLSNNQANVSTNVTTQAALRATKVALNDPAYAGDLIQYQIVVHNDGPSDARRVTLTDTLPVSTTYAGGDGTCGTNGRTVTCNLGDLVAGGSRMLLVQTRTDPATVHGTFATNLITATSPTASTPATATATSEVRQPVNGAVDLAVEKWGIAQASAGQLMTYTVVVTNLGPGTASAVQLVDALPYEIIGLATQTTQGTCNNSVVCQLGDIVKDGTATVVITGWVRTETISGTAVLNGVRVSSNNLETNPNNNADAFTTTVDSHVLLTIDKIVQPTSVSPGGSLSYRILVSNHGPSLARSVVVTDLLPAEVLAPLLTSARGYCTDNTCYLGDVPPGETVTILILGTVSSSATGAFTNTAVLTTTTALDLGSVTQAEVKADVGDNADLIMFKSAPATVYAGATVSYVLTVRNAGPSTAVNVQVQDVLPPNVVVADVGTCSQTAPQAIICPPTAVPTLTAGAEISWTLVVSTDSDLPAGTTLQNRATVASDTLDPNPVNNTVSVETSIIGRSDLGVRKVASPSTVFAGNELTYTIVLTNGGPSDATSVRLVDILPAQVRLLHPIEVERSTAVAIPVICLDTVCETSLVEEGEIVTFTLHASVKMDVVHQTVFTNTATVYSPSDPDFSNNVSRAAVQSLRESALVIAKTATPDPAITGAALVYQVLIQNLGPSDADAVVGDDIVPAGFHLTGVSSSQGNCTSLPCALGDLPVGDQATITLQGTVDTLQSEPLVNTASVTASTPLTDVERSTVTITTPVSSLADLELILESTPTAVAGLTATVYANVINLGPSSAVGTIVTVTLPTGATYDSADLPTGWFVAANLDGTVTVTTTNILTPGANVPLAFVVDIAPDVAPGTSLEFVGLVVSQTPDNDPTHNMDTADTAIVALADLEIFKTGPDTLVAGTMITYLITVTNHGPSVSSIRDIKDTLPPGMNLVQASLESDSGELAACVDAICQATQPLGVDAVMTMTVVGRAAPTLPDRTVLTNTATVFAEYLTPDPIESNNQVQHSAIVTLLAQIGVEKYDLVDPVAPDGLLVYVFVVTNTGPSNASNLVVTDTLPAGLTFHSTTGACTADSSGVVSCFVGDLVAGGETNFLLVVRANPDVPNGAVLTNQATLTSTTPLTDSTLTTDETTRVETPGGPLADLEVHKVAHATSVLGGGLITFTLAVTNHGPSPANNVELLDLLPSGLTPVAVATSQGFCNLAVDCLLGGLDFTADVTGVPTLEGTATVTVVARAAANLEDGVQLTNAAYVQSEKRDPAPDNNLSDATVAVVAYFADLRLFKTGPMTATAGDLLNYSLLIVNDGPATAYTVTVSDPLPDGLSFVAATPTPADGSSTEPVWHFAELGVGEQATINLVVRVDVETQAAFLIRNTATVSTTTPDPNAANNTSSAQTQSYGQADLEVIKASDTQVVLGDDTVQYTITVNNHGPSISQRVDVKDQLPPGMELLSLGASQGVCVDHICQLGDIDVDRSVEITAVARVISPTAAPGTVLTNTATAFTNTPDPKPEDNSDGTGVTVGPVVNLGIAKTTRTTTATVGTTISYTVIVTNYGPSDAPAVVARDEVPYGFLYLRATAPGGCELVSVATLVCDAGKLPAQRSMYFDILFFIEAVGGDMVTNVVHASAPGASEPSGGATDQISIPTNPRPTAILLSRLETIRHDNVLEISWQTTDEFMAWGFRLWRNTLNERQSATLLTPDTILARGAGSTYTYLDEQVEEGVTYWYWLEQIGINGGGWEYDVITGRIGEEPTTAFMPRCFLPVVLSGAEYVVDVAPSSSSLDSTTLTQHVYLPAVCSQSHPREQGAFVEQATSDITQLRQSLFLPFIFHEADGVVAWPTAPAGKSVTPDWDEQLPPAPTVDAVDTPTPVPTSTPIPQPVRETPASVPTVAVDTAAPTTPASAAPTEVRRPAETQSPVPSSATPVRLEPTPTPSLIPTQAVEVAPFATASPSEPANEPSAMPPPEATPTPVLTEPEPNAEPPVQTTPIPTVQSGAQEEPVTAESSAHLTSVANVEAMQAPTVTATPTAVASSTVTTAKPVAANEAPEATVTLIPSSPANQSQ